MSWSSADPAEVQEIPKYGDQPLQEVISAWQVSHFRRSLFPRLVSRAHALVRGGHVSAAELVGHLAIALCDDAPLCAPLVRLGAKGDRNAIECGALLLDLCRRRPVAVPAHPLPSPSPSPTRPNKKVKAKTNDPTTTPKRGRKRSLATETATTTQGSGSGSESGSTATTEPVGTEEEPEPATKKARKLLSKGKKKRKREDTAAGADDALVAQREAQEAQGYVDQLGAQ